jgi:hypothetical protein
VDVTPNCRTAAAAGLPNRQHHCTGCDCPCHHVPAPAGFRALVEATRRRDDEPGEGE